MSAPAPTAPTVETPWRRLDPRMLVIGPLTGWSGCCRWRSSCWSPGRATWSGCGSPPVGVLVVLGSMLTWRTTRYRITAERVELHSGWLSRQRRSVPRDRIRTVDLTARLLHRVFGLERRAGERGVGRAARAPG